ncbi:MAG: DegT/DnrJ/EryC1/StrS family aminotransferase [candidate division WOR-3 bacterium]|nr:MAG: DegT/DnrJ/EryC1/StrS family aminotransferase [candidate division WOR-3 bacterium]
MQVPFMDLNKQYQTIKDEIDRAIHDTIQSCAFVAGVKVKDFEENFAAYCGVDHAIGVSSGTSALYVALRALGIGTGDAVITIPHTFIATVEAISLTGATPVFVDIDEDSYNISTDKIIEYIEGSCTQDGGVLVDKSRNVRVKAVLPVHLYGQMADMRQILEIAQQYNLYVVEDAAQAHGAEYGGKKAGSIGDIGAFSFYPSKNLGAYGQGGMVTTKDAKLSEKIRLLIDHGQRAKNLHAFEGWNFKMDGLQAAILNVKLGHLDRWNEERRSNAAIYGKHLSDIDGIIVPKELAERKHVYHLYVVRSKNRDVFVNFLKDSGIGSSVHYPTPVHLQEAYQHLSYKEGDFSVSEACAREVISLPMFPELTAEEVEYVCDAISRWPEHR